MGRKCFRNWNEMVDYIIEEDVKVRSYIEYARPKEGVRETNHENWVVLHYNKRDPNAYACQLINEVNEILDDSRRKNEIVSEMVSYFTPRAKHGLSA